MSETKEFKINGFTFNIPVWGLEKTIQNERHFLPILSQPLINGFAYGEDESMMIPAIISGVTSALQEVNIPEFVGKALDGVTFYKGDEYTEFTKSFSATIKNMDREGVDIFTVHMIVAGVIKVNFGPFLQNASNDSIDKLMSL